jgi:hypothetical protein
MAGRADTVASTNGTVDSAKPGTGTGTEDAAAGRAKDRAQDRGADPVRKVGARVLGGYAVLGAYLVLQYVHGSSPEVRGRARDILKGVGGMPATVLAQALAQIARMAGK